MPLNPDFSGRWRLALPWEADTDLCQGDRVNFGGTCGKSCATTARTSPRRGRWICIDESKPESPTPHGAGLFPCPS